jgi:hypothetical protein
MVGLIEVGFLSLSDFETDAARGRIGWMFISALTT